MVVYIQGSLPTVVYTRVIASLVCICRVIAFLVCICRGRYPPGVHAGLGTLLVYMPGIHSLVYIPWYTLLGTLPYSPWCAALLLPDTGRQAYRAKTEGCRTVSYWRTSYRYPFHCWSTLSPLPVSLLVDVALTLGYTLWLRSTLRRVVPFLPSDRWRKWCTSGCPFSRF